MTLGMVLEGGGMRGLYTAGVLDRFMDENIFPDGMVAVSAGALFGMNYASKQRGRTLRYNKQYIGDKRYISFRSLIRTGDIVNKDFAYYTVPFELDVFDELTFEKSGIEFYATVTNVETGEPEYVPISKGFEQIEILRASGSMPFVSKVVEYQDKKYLDGGVSDSIPVQKALALGYDKLVVILTRPSDYRETKPNTRIIDLFYGRYPAFAEALKMRYLHYNETVEEVIRLETEKKLFVIRPSESMPVKPLEHDPEKLQELYDLGFSDAIASMAGLKAYLRN